MSLDFKGGFFLYKFGKNTPSYQRANEIGVTASDITTRLGRSPSIFSLVLFTKVFEGRSTNEIDDSLN